MKKTLLVVLQFHLLLTQILGENEDYKDHKCLRPCNGKTMTCEYKFIADMFITMSRICGNCPYNMTDCYNANCLTGDGFPKPLYLVNKQLPAPVINVCLGDRIVVDVRNDFPSDAITIHWHGIHQTDTPYMDGVPYVTQCPIQPRSTFRYDFLAENAGTHFYHAHLGFLRTDGLFGGLIVRTPDSSNPHRKLYDYDLPEHTMAVLDWSHSLGITNFEQFVHYKELENSKVSLLVNGLGRSTRYFDDDGEPIYTPTARFVVKKGKRYRMRLINAGVMDCPIEISIDKHQMTAISGDGFDFKPETVDSIVTYAGERYDFILNTNQKEDVYWIKFRTHLFCGNTAFAYQVAVLQYGDSLNDKYPPGHPSYDDTFRPGIQLNPVNIQPENSSIVMKTLFELTSVAPRDKNVLKEKPDMVIFLPFDLREIYYPKALSVLLALPQINNISYEVPPFPLLTQPDDVRKLKFCDDTTFPKNCSEIYCECTYVQQIPLNTVVEIVLIDEGSLHEANHPMHLHGYAFRVVAMQKLGDKVNQQDVRKLYNDGKIKKNLNNPPLKDTVPVPDGGFTIIRFKADNPGFWTFHCHVERHIEFGMMMVFKVGKDWQMVRTPRNFPKCGDYLPATKRRFFDSE